jgi:hypothetical protein
MRVWLSVLMLVAVTLSATGCGGSKGGTNTATSSAAASVATTPITSASSQTGATGNGSGKPLSASQLVARADAICARLNTKLGRDVVHNQPEVARVAPHRAAIEQAALTELSRLLPPASMATDYQQMLAVRHTLIEDTIKLGIDAKAGYAQAERPVYSSSTALVGQMAATAQRNGFKHCGQLG